MDNDTLICIPAFNEEKNIAQVIKNATSVGDVIVFDNNSSDKTKKISLDLGSKVINVRKSGYEEVILKIVNFFQNSNYDILVIIDGDGEVGLSFLAEVTSLIEGCDIVIGNRDIKKRWSERLICFLFDKFYGIKDIYCGFKIITNKGISKNILKNTMGTSIVNKKAIVKNLSLRVDIRTDESKLGDSFSVNIKILFQGLKGLLS